MANEYKKIVARIPEGLEHLEVPDPDAAWARNKGLPPEPTALGTKQAKSASPARTKRHRPLMS